MRGGADFVEQRGVFSELDKEVDVGPGFVVPSGDGPEDPGRGGVVLGYQCPDGVPMLLDPRGGRTASARLERLSTSGEGSKRPFSYAGRLG